MSDDPLKAALETNGPAIQEPAADDSALRTGLKLGGLTVLDLRNLLLAIGGLVVSVVALEWASRTYTGAFWIVVVLAGLCLANVLLNTIILFRRRRREAALREWAVQPLPSFEADYFRVGPYTGSAADCKRYRRPDGADADILEWVRKASEPILYLSGLSGAGKSSLLNAALLPALAAGDPQTGIVPCHIISIPEQDAPIAFLREALLAPGAIWKNPTEDRQQAPIAEVLADACAQLARNGRRLLILCDQFEVVLIRHDRGAAETQPFAGLLQAIAAGRRKVFPGLTVLLTFRSDYDDLLKTLHLPRWVEGKNGRRVAPFSRLVARAFLADPRSGIQLADGRLNEALDEAEAVTSTPGLIRPIALNMLGKLLERHAGHDPVKIPRGALLAHDIRRTVEAAEVRSHARPVLRSLLSDGLRIRRSVAESAAATGLAPEIVSGCLKRLLDWPLVRCVEESDDPARSRWEIAHDFIARLLTPILETPLRTLAERIRPFVTPSLLVLTLGTAAALWLGQEIGRENAIVAELSNRFGIHADVQRDKVFATAVQREKVDQTSLPNIAELLKALKRPIELNLRECTALQNVDGLHGLPSLESLVLSWCEALQNVDGLQGLPSLQILNLSDCTALQNVDVLQELPSLQILDLGGCSVLQNVAGLQGLPSLQSLDLSSCRALRNVDGLQELTSLQFLDLSHCYELQNVDVLQRLTSLQSLRLSSWTALQNVDVLQELTSLQSLVLSNCDALQNVDVLQGLPSLQSLDLSSCDALQNVDGLHGLTSLQILSLNNCGALQNVDGLQGLPSLQSLDLSSCRALRNVDGLQELTSLQSLDLSSCTTLQNVDVLQGLTALKEVGLFGTLIQDEKLFTALRARGVHLEFVDEHLYMPQAPPGYRSLIPPGYPGAMHTPQIR